MSVEKENLWAQGVITLTTAPSYCSYYSSWDSVGVMEAILIGKDQLVLSNNFSAVNFPSMRICTTGIQAANLHIPKHETIVCSDPACAGSSTLMSSFEGSSSLPTSQ